MACTRLAHLFACLGVVALLMAAASCGKDGNGGDEDADTDTDADAVDEEVLDVPVDEEDVPDDQQAYTEINALWFKDKEAARAKVAEIAPSG